MMMSEVRAQEKSCGKLGVHAFPTDRNHSRVWSAGNVMVSSQRGCVCGGGGSAPSAELRPIIERGRWVPRSKSVSASLSVSWLGAQQARGWRHGTPRSGGRHPTWLWPGAACARLCITSCVSRGAHVQRLHELLLRELQRACRLQVHLRGPQHAAHSTQQRAKVSA